MELYFSRASVFYPIKSFYFGRRFVQIQISHRGGEQGWGGENRCSALKGSVGAFPVRFRVLSRKI